MFIVVYLVSTTAKGLAGKTSLRRPLTVTGDYILRLHRQNVFLTVFFILWCRIVYWL